MQDKHKEKSSRWKTISWGTATLLTCCLSISTTTAQESIHATGGKASGSGGSASYSVGQVFYTMSTSTSGSVAQGVQQPYEIWVRTSIEEAKGISLSVSAYPNPTTDILQLKMEGTLLKNTSYYLYDIQGKLLQSKKITSSLTSIDMSNLSSSTYFVKIAKDNKEIKTFKIIKN